MYSLNKQTILFNLEFFKIVDCLVNENICYVLSHHSTKEKKVFPLILKICLKEFTILKSFFLLNDLNNIILKKNSENGYY